MKTIFVSVGLERGTNQYPEIDRMATRDCLRMIFQYTAEDRHQIIVRDHPAVTSLLEAFMGAANPDMVVVPEQFSAEDIARIYKPDVAFYLAGNDDVAWDHMALARDPAILSVPLPGTGGAAELIEGRIGRDEQIKLDGERGGDVFGFYRIARTMTNLRPPLR
ncbi:MAG: hypothetical protein KJ667_05735 [Alphaproteobacteria bacterium]|nr:hypothetical protein [Alphaproteobacteria bacterium]